jgi:hypothetical protein
MITSRAAGRGDWLGWSLLTALTGCWILGCGTSDYKAKALPVEGVVKWEKGPMITELEGGSVEFEKDGTVAATAALTGDGTFKLMDPLPPGTYRVRVVPPAVAARKGAELDPRLQSFDTSGLKFTATSEPGLVTFELKKRGR